MKRLIPKQLMECFLQLVVNHSRVLGLCSDGAVVATVLGLYTNCWALEMGEDQKYLITCLDWFHFHAGLQFKGKKKKSL